MEFSIEGIASGFSVFSFIYSLFGSTLGIVTYVLRALSLYTISKRRGINHPWMSWVPVLDLWVLGCISDQYQYVVKGKEKNKRKWLLGLNIAMSVIYIVFFVCFGIMIGNAVGGTFAGFNDYDLINKLLGPAMGLLICLIPMVILAVVVMVVRYIAMYDLYTSCTPRNDVLFLLLSILFHVTEPFFLFAVRNKDEGMPPRRQEQYIPPQIYDAPQENREEV